MLRDTPAAVHREVLRQAADGIKNAMQYDPVNICEVAGFVDTLVSSPSPFSEEKLGGGPWQVSAYGNKSTTHTT